MEKAVRFGGEAGDDRADATGLEVGLDDVANEIAARFGLLSHGRFRRGIHHVIGSGLRVATGCRGPRGTHYTNGSGLATYPGAGCRGGKRASRERCRGRWR